MAENDFSTEIEMLNEFKELFWQEWTDPKFANIEIYIDTTFTKKTIPYSVNNQKQIEKQIADGKGFSNYEKFKKEEEPIKCGKCGKEFLARENKVLLKCGCFIHTNDCFNKFLSSNTSNKCPGCEGNLYDCKFKMCKDIL